MSVALVIQHVKRVRRIMSSVACLALQHFPKLSHKRHDFRKKPLNIKCVFLLAFFYIKFLGFLLSIGQQACNEEIKTNSKFIN